ncbi:MAG: hypothetical protein WBA57_25245 [Elainellaceae cyanobacterium]
MNERQEILPFGLPIEEIGGVNDSDRLIDTDDNASSRAEDGDRQALVAPEYRLRPLASFQMLVFRCALKLVSQHSRVKNFFSMI